MKDFPESRAEAKSLGARHYYTGKPCPSGHNGLRYTSKGSCVDCAKECTKSSVKNGYYVSRYEKNRDEILALQRERYRNSREVRERCAITSRAWIKKNPDKVRLYKRQNKHKRRSIKRKGVSTAKVREWLSRQDMVCHWCHKPCSHNSTIDHYVPLAKGGEHELHNLVIACRPCNVRKQAKDPEVFAAEMATVTPEMCGD